MKVNGNELYHWLFGIVTVTFISMALYNSFRNYLVNDIWVLRLRFDHYNEHIIELPMLLSALVYPLSTLLDGIGAIDLSELQKYSIDLKYILIPLLSLSIVSSAWIYVVIL